VLVVTATLGAFPACSPMAGLSGLGEYQLTNQEMNDNDIEKIKNHWIETSNDDFKTMNELFKSKSYNWALFVGHISVAKGLTWSDPKNGR